MSNAEEPQDLDSLLQPFLTRKEMLYSRLHKLYELSKQVKHVTQRDEFLLKVVDMSSWREKFEQSLNEIITLKRRYDSKFVPSYQELDSFDDLYYHIRKVEKISLENKNAAQAQSLESSSKCVRPKLPKLQIYHFDGELENWPTFKDTFTSLIHNNKDISDIEKFYYLLSSVSGGAFTIVKSMPVSSENYSIVWNALLKRYENQRALANYYLDKMFNFKPLKIESAVGLNSFLRTFKENESALQALKIKDLASYILFYVALRNVDPVTRRDFEQNINQSDLPLFKHIIEFVEKQVRVLEMSEHTSCIPKISQSTQPTKSQFNKKKVNSSVSVQSLASGLADVNKPTNSKQNAISCLICQKPHTVYRCSDFFALTPVQRMEKVRALNLCSNCLRPNHKTEECSSKFCCSVCKGRHHHSLHIDAKTNDNSVALACSAKSTVLLGTARVHVQDGWGQMHSVRAVIDSGAMTSYVTQKCFKLLSLPRRKCHFEPVGLGGQQIRDYGQTTLTISPRDCNAKSLKTDAVIVENITGNLPNVPLPQNIVDEFTHLPLADSGYYQPAAVDILLAGDIFPYIYDGGKIQPQRSGLPIALHSIFGYVIVGQTDLDCDNDNKSTPSCSLLGTQNSIENIMNSFWEVENIPTARSQNPDDSFAEQLFVNSCKRDETGRYTVQYPFRSEFELGDSKEIALRRFKNLESKLKRQPELKIQYHEFMCEYENLGHMTCLGNFQNIESKYIIPHFCIIKPSSTTTRLRVVFDASCRTSNNLSLNSVVLPGPKLQADINEILINFRLGETCMSADICKMYRQVLVDENQRPYQHILWRFSDAQPIQIYQLNTLTYGVASSPYCAIKVLHTLAKDEAENFPEAAMVLKSAFFMDDFLWSVDSIQEAVQLQNDLRSLLQKGGFVLRKWSSNKPEVLDNLPDDHRESPVPISFENEKNLAVKVLGLQWLPDSDVFTFTSSEINKQVTKRTVLSQIGRLFDPLGFVSPCIFFAKCFMQKLWTLKIEWDQPLGEELEHQWLSFIDELPLLSKFKLDRHATIVNHNWVQLLGFCDASSYGFAAVIYLRSKNASGQSKVSLLTAKSKVAPLKTVTIPRLELMAAHLLSKLVAYVKSILQNRLVVNEVLLFTDSSVVLAWLNTPCHTLKTFVANRVSKILEVESVTYWYHVQGVSNPADVCSRGATPSALLATPEWTQGPDWLNNNQQDWPIKSIEMFQNCDPPPEVKSQNCALLTNEPAASNLLVELSEKYSSYNKLIYVIARCLVFVRNSRLLAVDRSGINANDKLKAHDLLIKAIQRHYFESDIIALSKGLVCRQTLRKLNPFLDSDNFLRVGGRLSQSDLTYTQKHPLLLPNKCNLTRIIIEYFHRVYLHVGPRTLQGIISQKFWIISARSAIRTQLLKCVQCFKVRPTVNQPVMGELPKYRLENVYPFHTVGIDIGGPFITKESNRRNAASSKAYVCVFVCCSTRAVHLEVLSSLSKECFLACFDRFTSRRGLCKTIISDNATNFVSAGKHLKEVTEFFVKNSSQINDEFLIQNVEWKHNPPTGSHFGGLYEAVVKQAKLHMKKVLGEKCLSFEELSTFFSRVEAVLNSRPICSISNDANEFQVLTPAHFLIGRDLLAVPQFDILDVPVYSIKRFEAVQQYSQRFWLNWKRDYLHSLQQRQKWFKLSKNVKLGDVVLLHSDSAPLHWPLGRIIKIHPGPDNVVRVVTVRSKNKDVVRPVTKLSILPIEENN